MEEFAAYGPVVGCAIVPACAIALLLSWLMNLANAPAWTHFALGAIYATFPCGMFLRWAWDKKAIRLRNGRLLGTPVARRHAVAMWLTALAVILWRYLTW